MSDAFAEKVKPESSDASQGGRSVTLSATLHPNGQIEFALPLQNKILCYGLLEAARAQADKLYLLDEVKREHTARGGLDGLLKRMNGGS